ncbi:hypothetical protein LXL04_025514 [Taraxacum kok-saghyz]
MKKRRQEENFDRLSGLPDPIVHHIMSFLRTTDLTKLSILSKRFFILWSTSPVIDFDRSAFSRGTNFTSTTNDFLNHIRNSIWLRRIDTAVSKFRVNANLRNISTDHRLDSAISFAINNGVKSMDLNLGLAKYQFPDSFASRSINVLRLRGFSLNPCNVILSCPSLKTLSLSSCVIPQDIKFSSPTLEEIELHLCDVRLIEISAPNLNSFSFNSRTNHPHPCRIDVLQCQNIAYLSLNNVVNGQDDLIEEHISTLRKLETLIFNRCQDIHSITIENERVKRVEISNCPLLNSIQVKAPSLESFQYIGTTSTDDDNHTIADISFIPSKFIKDLYIRNASITDEWLATQLPTWCYLESLRLDACNSLNKIEASHEKLRNLELLNCKNLKEAEIDTPQLVSFVHIGNMIQFEKLVTRGICTATLFINPWTTYNDGIFYKWRKLLSFFGYFKGLKLICNCQKELIMPEHLREVLIPPFYDLQSLEVHVKGIERIEKDMVDSLLWLWPSPNTIRIYSGSPSKLQMTIKFAYNNIMKEDDKNPIFCCKSKPIKCWRHKLRRLDIQTRDKNGSAELQKYFHTNAMRLESLSLTKLR